MKRPDPDAQTLRFEEKVLWEGFCMSRGVSTLLNPFSSPYSISDDFMEDIKLFLPTLPFKHGQVIDRALLFDMILEGAKQCEYTWCMEYEGRLAVFKAVVWAGVSGR